MNEILYLAAGLVMTTAAVAVAARRLGLSTPILLVIAGMSLALVPGLPKRVTDDEVGIESPTQVDVEALRAIECARHGRGSRRQGRQANPRSRRASADGCPSPEHRRARA